MVSSKLSQGVDLRWSAHRIQKYVESASADEVNDLVYQFFVGLRLGLSDSGRLSYSSDVSPFITTINDSEMNLRLAIVENLKGDNDGTVSVSEG